MRKINTLISPSELEIALDILNGAEIKEIHMSTCKQLTQSDIEDMKERIYLFVEEFAPVEYLILNRNVLSSSSRNILIEGLYKTTSVLPPKTKKLKELYNIKVYIGYANSRITYKSLENVNDEVLKFLTREEISSGLKTFLDSKGITSYAKEFLCINGTSPSMFRSKNIMLYSALLNYDWDVLTRVITKNGSSTFLNVLEGEGLLTQNDEMTKTKWEKLSSSFKVFLDQLVSRTIHYDG